MNSILPQYQQIYHVPYTIYHVCVRCDNMACVYVLNTGQSRDPFLLKCAREIWLLAASYDFNISAEHVTSRDNARADALSQAVASSQHLDRSADMCSEFRS